MKIFKLIIISVSAFVVFATQSLAQSPVVLDPVLVSARGYPELISETPGSVGVITAEEIAISSPVSISNVMQEIPGVYKNSDSLWGSDVNIRGLSRDSVIMVIDGVRVNTANDLNAQYGLLDPHDVQSVEVLKGPISSLYGSGSIGGVVNVITRRGKFTESDEYHGGSLWDWASNPDGFSTYDYVNFNSQDFTAYVSQSFRNYGSYEDGSNVTMRNSQFEDYQTKLVMAQKWNECNSTEANFQYYEGQDIGIPGTGTAPIPAAADLTYPAIRRGLVNITHTYAPDGEYYKQSVFNIYYQYIDRRAQLDNFPLVSPVEQINPGANHYTYGTKWQNEITWENHQITTGLDVWERQLESFRTRTLRNGNQLSDTPLPDATFLSSGVFAEDSIKVTEPLKVNLGGRLDNIYVSNDATEIWAPESSNDLSWNAHLGAIYGLSEEWRLKGLIAKGYRAATIEERYSYLELGGGKTKYGNPDLDPEDSTYYEIGTEWLTKKSKISLTAFYDRLTDLIADQIVDERTIISENINKATIYGTELEALLYLLPEFEVRTTVAFAKGEDTLNNEDLPNIAPLNGLVSLKYLPIEGAWGLIEMPWTAAQNETPQGVSSSEEWTVVNIRLGYKLPIAMVNGEMYAGVNNVFDKTYYNYLTNSRGFQFNEPGQSWVVGLGVRF